MKLDMNLSEKQIDGIDRLLNLNRNDLVKEAGICGMDGRTQDALVRKGMLEYTNDGWWLTPLGIQSYCATILTKWTGSTHERIHCALNDYQRLFG